MGKEIWFAPLILMTAACGKSGADASDSAAEVGATEALPATAEQIEAKWGELEDACRGAVNRDSAETVKACADRDAFDRKLTEGGWCHGNESQAEFEKRWQKCQNSPQQNQSSRIVFGLRFQDNLYGGSNGVTTVRSYSIENLSQNAANIKWVLINGRDECLALPLLNSSGEVTKFGIVDETSQERIAESVSLPVGQSLHIDLGESVWRPVPACGRVVRVKIGTTAGEINIDNTLGM